MMENGTIVSQKYETPGACVPPEGSHPLQKGLKSVRLSRGCQSDAGNKPSMEYICSGKKGLS